MKKWIEEKVALSSDHTVKAVCPRCSAPVLKARAGRVAALDVVADQLPITADEEAQVLAEGRMTWCLVHGDYRPSRIVWRDQWHRSKCSHQILKEHRCKKNQ